MQQPTLSTIAHENTNNAYNLSAQMVQLEVVQVAVDRLMDKVDEITDKGWHEDSGKACASILQIQETLRLINMAFHPLFKEMSQDVDTLNSHAEELYQTVIKSESEQSAVAASNI